MSASISEPQLLLDILELQHRILSLLQTDCQSHVKAWYTPAEVARQLKRKPATVRHWCRLGRIAARKRCYGRGDKLEWEIAADELVRLRSHGLLPKEK